MVKRKAEYQEALKAASCGSPGAASGRDAFNEFMRTEHTPLRTKYEDTLCALRKEKAVAARLRTEMEEQKRKPEPTAQGSSASTSEYWEKCYKDLLTKLESEEPFIAGGGSDGSRPSGGGDGEAPRLRERVAELEKKCEAWSVERDRMKAKLLEAEEEVERLLAEREEWPYADEEEGDEQGSESSSSSSEEEVVMPQRGKGKKDKKEKSKVVDPQGLLAEHREGECPPAPRKGKEAEKVVFSGYPTVNNIKHWKTDLYSKVAAASGRDDHFTTQWLKKAEREDLYTLEDLSEVPKSIFTLDRKVHAGLIPLCKGDFGQSVAQADQEHYDKHARPLSAIQLLRLIYNDLRTNKSLRTFHNMLDLSKLEWQGDEHWEMARFRNNLNQIMMDIGDQMNEAGKQDFLLGHFEKSTLMKPEAQHFRRPEPGIKKDYQYLLDALGREIDRGREREHHAKREEGLKRANDKKDRHGKVIHAANETGGGKGEKGTGSGKGTKNKKEAESSGAKASWLWGTQTEEEKRVLSIKHPSTGKVPCVPFFATGVCPWDNMGSMCYRSHDHTINDKELAIMRKVNERREQIRAERKSAGKGSGSGAGNGKGGKDGKDKKTKGKNKIPKKNENPGAGGGGKPGGETPACQKGNRAEASVAAKTVAAGRNCK